MLGRLLLSLAALVLNAFRLRPDWVKVLVLEIQRSSRFAEPAQLAAVGRLFDAIERIIRDGQERGELRPELDAGIGVYAFVGALDLVITSLVLGVTRIEGGERDFAQLSAWGMAQLQSAGMAPDYFEVREAGTLREPGEASRELVLLTAARLGKARLIDNLRVSLY